MQESEDIKEGHQNMTTKETQQYLPLEEELLAGDRAETKPEAPSPSPADNEISEQMKALAKALAVTAAWEWVGLLDKK